MERDSFINDLENYLMEEEAKELELVVTGDIEQDPKKMTAGMIKKLKEKKN